MFGLRSARTRALLATSILLALLCVVGVVAAWRTHGDREARSKLEHRSMAIASQERARAELLAVTSVAAVSAVAEDPAPFLSLYQQQWASTDEALAQARAELVVVGEPDEVAGFDKAVEQVNEFQREADSGITSVLSTDKDGRLAAVQQMQERLQPLGATAVGALEELANDQRSKLADERAAADRAGDVTLLILVGFTGIAFLAGSATMVWLVASVLGPLASLQASVRAIASGNLKARAKLSGPLEVASLARDFNQMVDERVQAEEALKLQAATDGLTGLPDHHALQDALASEVERSRRHSHSMAVLMMDIDGLKLFNDTYGHQEGDRVLKQVAAALKRELRPHDIVGRYSGDEFMAILPETNRDDAVSCAKRLLEAVSREHVQPRMGQNLPLGLSMGLAVFPDDSQNKEELIAYADASLLEAKQLSGGNLVIARREPDDTLASRRTPFGVLDALVQAVDRKDRYTRRHSQQNAEFAVGLGKVTGLSDGTVSALRVAGILHDVGKIGVPDEILRKPGPLTEEEYAIMREHVVLSNLIVHGVPNLQDVSDAVYAHHERWDGKGYPRGLKGKETPLPGRIMALVDAYSAMILDRPYRTALSQEEAFAELRRNAGTQFDPSLVEPFIAMIETQLEAVA
jgi:diguanylate cyclase (GGDEF)-like protein